MVWTTPLKRLGMAVCATFGSAALMSCVGASGTDPLQQALDAINTRTKHEVVYRSGVQWSLGSVGDCTTFALHNYVAIKALGLRPAIWSVVDERGEGHAVVMVGDAVLDNRFWRLQTREGLVRLGYRFRCPVGQLGVLIKQPAIPARCGAAPEMSAGAEGSAEAPSPGR